MKIEEARLHIGFLIEELSRSSGQLVSLDDFGVRVTDFEPETGKPVWHVLVQRPGGRTIEFCVRPITSKGWGADFEVLDSGAVSALAAGRMCYLFTYLTWLYDHALESKLSTELELNEELKWQNEK